MSESSPAVDLLWATWIGFIKSRKVVPIVGAELLQVRQNGQDVNLHQVIAERLAVKLGVNMADVAAGQFRVSSPRAQRHAADAEPFDDDPVNAVVSHFLKDGRRKNRWGSIGPAVFEVVDSLDVESPPALRKLAEIRHFNLYITTTFDGLLAKALNEVRYEGQRETTVSGFSRHGSTDLPGPPDKLPAPMVYHLFGEPSELPGSCAVTEEDTLEFLNALRDEAGGDRFEQLFAALGEYHLLLIGNRFPDWLARFFMRLARGCQLSKQRDSAEMVVDRFVHSDTNLALFLTNFSSGTEIYDLGDAVQFVDALHARYMQDASRAARTRTAAPAVTGVPPLQIGAAGDGTNNRPTRADAVSDRPQTAEVFLSYGRGLDEPKVAEIYGALRARGISVWFDRQMINGGDTFDRMIVDEIARCMLFLPIISVNTRRRGDGFFRMEWDCGAKRTRRLARDRRFLVPVALVEPQQPGDQSDIRQSQRPVCPADPDLPVEFRDVHWEYLDRYESVPKAFVDNIHALILDLRSKT